MDSQCQFLRPCTRGQLVSELLEWEYKGERIDVSAVNAAGDTALTFSCRYGHVKTAKALLDAGLDLEQTELSRPYWTSLHRAAANGHTTTVRLLLHKLLNDSDIEVRR